MKEWNRQGVLAMIAFAAAFLLVPETRPNHFGPLIGTWIVIYFAVLVASVIAPFKPESTRSKDDPP